MELAAELGVTRMLLPENLLAEGLNELEKLLGVQAEQVEGYYSFRMS